MLPTQELFRSIPCPYYVAGLCERPHCFFRHTKSDILLARKIEQGLLLEDGAFSDDDEQSSQSNNNNGSSKQDERLNSISAKISAASTHAPASVTSSSLKSDLPLPPQPGVNIPTKGEPRKRPAVDLLEGSSKKIRLSLENDKNSGEAEGHHNHKIHSATPSPKLLEEVSQAYQNSIPPQPVSTKTNPWDSSCPIQVASIIDAQIVSNSNPDETLIEGKSDKKDSCPRKPSSHSHSSHSGNNHVRKSSSSSSSKTSSSHRKDSRKDKKPSSRNSSDSKDRSHKTSSSSHSHSSKAGRSKSTSHRKSASSSTSNTKEGTKERRDGGVESSKPSRTASATTAPTTTSTQSSGSNNNKESDTCKLEVDNDMDMDSPLDESECTISGNSDDFRFPEGSDYDDDPDEIAMECLKMFEDYKPTEEDHEANHSSSSRENSITTKSTATLSVKINDSLSDFGASKRRMAHSGAGAYHHGRPFPKAQNSGQELTKTLGQRIDSQRAKMEETIPAQGLPTSASGVNKKRIAHVSNVTGLLRPTPGSPNSGLPQGATSVNPEGNVSQSLNTPPFSSITAVKPHNRVWTTAQTSVKGQTRTAHLPFINTKVAKRPIVIVDSSIRTANIPNIIRQKVLDQIYDACIKIYVNDIGYAFKKAIAEESDIAMRYSSKHVYQSVSVSAITRLRRELKNMGGDAKNPKEIPGFGVSTQVVSHDKNLNGAGASNCSIQKVSREFQFPVYNELYKALRRYILSEQELIDNGFPRHHPSGEPGRAVAQSRYTNGCYVYDSTRRTCERCKKVYHVLADGSQAIQERCTHHSGRKNRQKVGRSFSTTYSCCGDESGAQGCITLDYHVPKSPPVSMCRGFVCSIKDPGEDNLMGYEEWDIVAIDCEMVSTTAGSELARATFVGQDNIILYDKLVKTSHPVLDYNTQFSGLTEEIMKEAKSTIMDVQAAMLAQLKPNSILIGHSLESDLVALRFKHDCVIDTSVLFPHRMGAPYKRALRNLVSDHLKKLIQNSGEGHDSAEDARAALSLVYFKLNDDSKLKELTPNGN